MQCNKLFITFLIFLLIFNSYNSLDIKDCGSFFTFDNIQVDDCDTENDASCILFIGQSKNMSFAISTGKRDGEFNIDGNLTNDVALFVRGGPRFNLTIEPINPCEVLACPLDIHYTATYQANVYVDDIYVPLSGDLQWSLNTNGDQLLCFQFPVILLYEA